VRLDLEPRQRGFVLGVPVRLKELYVSLQDPEGALQALAAPGGSS
jgi:hypothetical protein